MCISLEKSSFLSKNLEEEVSNNISAILPYNMERIDSRFKYLGFWIKPSGYGLNNWWWIIKIFEKRLNHWTYILLSMGDRLILIRSIFTRILVYWFSLERIPKSILNRLRQCIFTFLWGGNVNKRKMHLVYWKNISRPFTLRGWNIIFLSGLASCSDSRACGLFSEVKVHGTKWFRPNVLKYIP